MPVSSRLVHLVKPQPGHTILDLAAGLGDTEFLAAELIRPGGTLITSDFAPEMLTAAQKRAPANVDVRFSRSTSARRSTSRPGRSTACLCRWGYMLLDDPEFAPAGDAAGPGADAAVALAAWTGAGRQRHWSVLPIRILQRRGLLERDEPGVPGQFAWQDPNLIEDTMATAGFLELEVEAVEFAMRYVDADD